MVSTEELLSHVALFERATAAEVATLAVPRPSAAASQPAVTSLSAMGKVHVSQGAVAEQRGVTKRSSTGP